MKLPEFLGHVFTLGFIVTPDRIYRILTRSKDLEKTLLASHFALKFIKCFRSSKNKSGLFRQVWNAWREKNTVV